MRPMSLSSRPPGSGSARRLPTSTRCSIRVSSAARGPRRVLDEVAAGRPRGLLAEPADVGVQVARHLRRGVGGAQHVAACHVEVVLEQRGDGHRRERLLDGAVERVEPGDLRPPAVGEDHDLVADVQRAGDDLAGMAAVVVVGVVVRPDDPLHRQPRLVEYLAVGRDVDRLEVLEQRRPVVPRRGVRAVDHVVAVERGDRDARAARAAPSRRPKAARSAMIASKTSSVPVDEVHLVHARDEVRDMQQRRR